jgi:hypothetical protein
MEQKRVSLFLGILLAAAACSATEIIITPSGPVSAGTVLHFSAVIEDTLGDCTLNPGQHGPLYISRSGGSWKTEGIVPVHGSGAQTYTFQATYTVTSTDLADAGFCFLLCRPAQSCWAQAACFDNTKKCPSKPQTLTVTSPNGGEVWVAGLNKVITWTANWSGAVQLNLYQNNVFKGVIKSGVASTQGSFTWKVGATSKGTFIGPGFRVVIVKEYPGLVLPQKVLKDGSDNAFLIALPLPKPK